jgi:hypothetical protein
MNKHLIAGLLLLACAAPGEAVVAATIAAAERSYTADLATLYDEYQRVVSTREACLAGEPARRSEITEAYELWHGRHQRIIDDLDNRFAAIVKRASKNQSEYVKSYAKYQSEVLQMREENKKALLADKTSLAKRCDEFSAYLRHPKSDIPALYPAEFKNVYGVR